MISLAINIALMGFILLQGIGASLERLVLKAGATLLSLSERENGDKPPRPRRQHEACRRPACCTKTHRCNAEAKANRPSYVSASAREPFPHGRHPCRKSFPLRHSTHNRQCALDLALPVMATASTLEPQIRLAEEGFGLACRPRFAVRNQLERNTLVSVLDGHLRVASAFHILWPAGRHPASKGAPFVAFMAETLPKEPNGAGGGPHAAA